MRVIETGLLVLATMALVACGPQGEGAPDVAAEERAAAVEEAQPEAVEMGAVEMGADEEDEGEAEPE